MKGNILKLLKLRLFIFVLLSFLVGCSLNNKYIVASSDEYTSITYYTYKEPLRHKHTYKFKDCSSIDKHIHPHKDKYHKHKYTDNCQWFIDMRKKHNKKANQQKVDVFALQRKLKEKGYYSGAINGVVTPETRKALRTFMSEKNLN